MPRQAQPPSLRTINALASEGEQLRGSLSSVAQARLEQLRSLRHDAQRWTDEAAAVLKRGGPLQRLHELVEAASGVRAELQALPTLRERASASASWLQRMQQLLAERSAAPPLELALKDAKPLLKVDEVRALAQQAGEALRAHTDWLAQADALFRKPGCERALLALLRDDEPDAA